MSENLFANHVESFLGEFLDKYKFLLIQPRSHIQPSFQDNLLFYKSQECQIQIYLEHNRIYIEISALDINDPNLWYGIDVMACYVSKTSPVNWVFNLPRGIPLHQVIETQLIRWKNILDIYFKEIFPLFTSKNKIYELQETLDEFVQNYYSEHKEAQKK